MVWWVGWLVYWFIGLAVWWVGWLVGYAEGEYTSANLLNTPTILRGTRSSMFTKAGVEVEVEAEVEVGMAVGAGTEDGADVGNPICSSISRNRRSR